MDKLKCEETINHLEKLAKQIWMLAGSLIERDVQLNEYVRSRLYDARTQVSLAELEIRKHLKLSSVEKL